MSGRPNWYESHPPACTCASCQGGSGRRRRRVRDARPVTSPPPPRERTPESHGSDRQRNSGCVTVTIFLSASIALLAALGIFFFSDEENRAGIADWLNKFGATPTPSRIVALAAPTLTATATPEPTNTSTPEPTSTAVPTVRPTSTSTPTPELVATYTPTPTVTATEYRIERIDVQFIEAKDDLVAVDFTVNVKNVTGPVGGPPALVEISLNGGGRELIYIINDLAMGKSDGFVFRRDLTPGRHNVSFIIKDLVVDFAVDVDPDAISLSLPPTMTPSPTVTPTSEPTSTVTATPEPTNTPTPEPTSTATAVPGPTSTSTLVPSTATPLAPPTKPYNTGAPHLRHLEYKQYMLELINAERVQAGLNPVVLGDNIAAQLHAEAALEGCFSSHWGLNGLKPYMRYSLAGGYQSNGENGHGSDYCIVLGDGYRPLANIKQEIRKAMFGLMKSPGHRRNILDPWHKKINIGLAWDSFNFKAYQHFEGDYVEYGILPAITDNLVSFEGFLKNGASLDGERGIGVQIYYDPPPHRLTRGQVSRTYCYGSGLRVASLRKPLTGGWFYPNDESRYSYEPCPDPYNVPADAPAPRSHDEAHGFWQAAYDASQSRPSIPVTVPRITALNWDVSTDRFSVVADLSDVIATLGNGVYTVVLWAKLGGEDVIVSEYSIFHGITPPDTY